MNDFAKTRIVIVGVKTGVGRRGLQATTHDAPGSAAALSWRPDGVFPVISADIGGKQPFPVAKHHAVLVMPEGAALVNQRQHAASLGRQLGQRNGVGNRLRECVPGMGGA